MCDSSGGKARKGSIIFVHVRGFCLLRSLRSTRPIVDNISSNRMHGNRFERVVKIINFYTQTRKLNEKREKHSYEFRVKNNREHCALHFRRDFQSSRNIRNSSRECDTNYRFVLRGSDEKHNFSENSPYKIRWKQITRADGDVSPHKLLYINVVEMYHNLNTCVSIK